MQIPSFLIKFSHTKLWRHKWKILAFSPFALERHHLKHHSYPEKLADLVPDYLHYELEDVITGRPLRYRIKSDGTPLIYSIGLNALDDGGKPNRSAGKGDWAWMYSPLKGFTYSDYRK